MQDIANCICVIQARRGSSRLPDKILMPLNGRPVLAWVISRCQRIKGVDRVVCAIPEGEENDAVASVAEVAGADVVRGSEHDVLARYIKALATYPSNYVMRVTSDCPLLDPTICGNLLDQVAASASGYGATAWWPHGLDCEVVEASLLMEADRAADSRLDREHVTLWIKRRDDIEKVILKPERDHMKTERWVLDYPEDYEFLSRLLEDVEVLPDNSFEVVMAMLNKRPMLREINQRRIEDWQEKTKRIYANASEAERQSG